MIDLSSLSPSPEPPDKAYLCIGRDSNESFIFGVHTTWELFRATALRVIFPNISTFDFAMYKKLPSCELIYHFTDLHRLEKEYALDTPEDYKRLYQQLVQGNHDRVWVRAWTEEGGNIVA